MNDEKQASEGGDNESGPDLVLITGGRTLADCRNNRRATEKVTAAIDRLVQMDNLCLLIGAGASFHLGGPRIRGLTVQQAVESTARGGEALSDIEAASLKALWPGDRADLEDVLGILSTGIIFLRGSNGLTLNSSEGELGLEVLRSLQAKLNGAIARQCVLPRAEGARVQDAEDPWAAHRKFFTRLLRSRRGELDVPHVFTTNYDLAIEQALDEAGIPYLDGFIGTVRRRFHPEVFDEDPRARRVARAQASDALNLYKVHGSINWRAVGLGQGELTTTVEQVAGEPQEHGEMALIYPTPLKESDLLGYPYADMYRRFSGRLRRPETALLIVGYGFSDDHLNRAIFEGMLTNPTMQLFVVQPHRVLGETDGQAPLSRPARLAQTTDNRVSVLTGKAAEFESLADGAMPDPDKLAKPGRPIGPILQELQDALLEPREIPAKSE